MFQKGTEVATGFTPTFILFGGGGPSFGQMSSGSGESNQSYQSPSGSDAIIAADENPALMKVLSSSLIRLNTYDTDTLIHGLMSIFRDLSYSDQQVYNLLVIRHSLSMNARAHNRYFVIEALVSLFKDLHYDKNTIQYLLYEKYDICINCAMKCSRKNEMCSIHGCILSNCRCCCSVNEMNDDSASGDSDV